MHIYVMWLRDGESKVVLQLGHFHTQVLGVCHLPPHLAPTIILLQYTHAQASM